MMKPLALLSLFIFLLCATLADEVKFTRTVDGDPEPPAPGILGYLTIAGVDADQDGVRDDIEIWINNNGPDFNVRMAMKQMARAEQKFITIHPPSRENLSMALQEDWYAFSCFSNLISQYPKQQRRKLIDNMLGRTTNTPTRYVVGYLRHNKFNFNHVDSSRASNPEIELYQKKRCNFEIQNLKQVLEKIWSHATPGDVKLLKGKIYDYSK